MKRVFTFLSLCLLAVIMVSCGGKSVKPSFDGISDIGQVSGAGTL